ncbi:MAG: sugar O-acetyltransferase [Synergistaceae bacterium]|nr:sugar O-acetyltransferase [Synergistaceae bacterium]
MTEREKMTLGLPYNPTDDELCMLRAKAHRLCQDFNRLYDTDEYGRCTILRELLPDFDEEEIYFQGPIYFDYGMNIHIGRNFYANFNCTILDICPVNIGDNVMLGTGVSLLTALHPLRWQDRNTKILPDGSVFAQESGKPITIESNCWLASSVTVTGGVTIGFGSVIGAGSVITRDIPANVFAAGNPCRVIREIDNNQTPEALQA